jgi:hypothetical protein
VFPLPSLPDKAGSDNVIYRYKYVNNLVETDTEFSGTTLLVTGLEQSGLSLGIVAYFMYVPAKMFRQGL